MVNGHSWAEHKWSSAGAALEPSYESPHAFPVNRAENAYATAENAFPTADGDNNDDSLTATLVRPPHFVPFSMSEDPYADELAQRSAEFARHAALDDPTPPQGLPALPGAWADTSEDPPLAASLSLGQRFELAFAEDPQPEPTAEPETAENKAEVEEEPAPNQTPPQLEGPEAPEEDVLPQRVPAEPDVPATVEPAEELPLAGMPQLSRIASHLRRDDCPPAERPDGFDTDAVLLAVRSVAGVREAIMRTTPAGAHHLRLELAEGADPATISRMVARMLQDQMGIDAALAGDGPARIPGQAPAETPEPPAPPAPPVTLPGPRIGPGATPPSAAFESRPLERGDTRPPEFNSRPPEFTGHRPVDRSDTPSTRESRRRHPVSVPRRQASSELRPTERTPPTWRSADDVEQPPGSSPPPLHTERDQGPRAIIEHVQTSTFGLDATVEVRLTTGQRQASGVASGPAVDAYVLRLCASATAAAVDDLLREGTTTGESGRCFVEHAAIVPMGSCDVAVVVVLLVCGGWVEQLAGSALVSGDPRRAVVRATLGAVNRRLAALLPEHP